MRIEPGDVERAVKDILDLITQTAEPFDPPDQATFYSRLVSALVPVMQSRNEFMHQDDLPIAFGIRVKEPDQQS